MHDIQFFTAAAARRPPLIADVKAHQPPPLPVLGEKRTHTEMATGGYGMLGFAQRKPLPTVQGRSYWEAAGLPKRCPLRQLTEIEFVADLRAFLQVRALGGALPGSLLAAARPHGRGVADAKRSHLSLDTLTERGMEGGDPLADSGPRPIPVSLDCPVVQALRPSVKFDPDRFPDVKLNGQQLDIWALYREVVTRGGFR